MQNPRKMQLGQYTLERLLGGGAMGRVYLGNQEALQRQVAIKLMNFDDEKSLKRFQQEVAITSTLDHPHIIKIYDYGIENNVPYVVMQYLPGGTLADRIRHVQATGLPPISLGEASQLVEKLASAMDYAHQQGVIHRDIKPGNVMFDKHGYPYLVDFGIARLGVGGQELTQIGMTVGTPYYMAPEMWGPGELTPTIDQYAMAVLLYELLSGRHPFEIDPGKEPNLNLMYKHLNELPPPIHLLRRDLPHELTSVMRKALGKRPSERYGTMLEFANAFAEVARITPGIGTGFFRFTLPEKNVSDIRVPTDAGLASRIAAIASKSGIGQPGGSSKAGFKPATKGGFGSGVPMNKTPSNSSNRTLIAIVGVLAFLVVAGLILLIASGGGAPDEGVATSIAGDASPTNAVIAIQTDDPSPTPTAEATPTDAPSLTPTPEVTPTDEPATEQAPDVSPSPTLNEFALQLFATQTAEASLSTLDVDVLPSPTLNEFAQQLIAQSTQTAEAQRATSITEEATTENTPDSELTEPIISSVNVALTEEQTEEAPLSEVEQQQTLDAIVAATLTAHVTSTAQVIASATAEQQHADQTATASIPTNTLTLTPSPTSTPSDTPTLTNTPKPTFTPTPTLTDTPTNTPSPTFTPSPSPTSTPNETDIAATITQQFIESQPTNTPTITPTATPDAWSVRDETLTVRGWVPPRVTLSLRFVPMACFDAGDVEQCLPAPLEADTTLVTNAQYAQCVNGGACLRPLIADLYDPTGERRDEPVVGVTWFMAQTYCESRGGRLLTEREWLFIAQNNADFGATRREWLGTIAQGFDFAPYNANDGREDISRIVQGTVISMAVRGGVAGDRRFSTRATLNTNQNTDDMGFRCVQN